MPYKNPEDKKAHNKKRYENNKEKLILQNKENKNKKINNKKYRDKNKEKINENQKIYALNNKEKINTYKREYEKNRMEIDPLFKMIKNIRNLIGVSIKRQGFDKNSKTITILGCSFNEFKSYLESKFETWMDWGNKGKYNGELNHGWDIDHIIPISSAITEEDVIRLNHYTNLQPLCSKINRDIKKDNLI
jgi:hypothetical protein